jgi:bla regulator protein blaR1
MENLLKPEITSALGWTLLHSLWQGLLLATLYFVVSKLVKSSEVKYRFGIAAMLVQFMSAICTFIYVGDFKNSNEIIAKRVLHYFSTQQVIQNKMSLFDSIQFFLSTNLTVIVQVWFIGISLFLIKLIFDVWAVNRLKTNGLKQVDNLTLTKFNALVSSLKITKKIEIFESNHTSSPIVIGNLKPFILLPIGLASILTINELEAILAHELAHIKRNDFLVNIIQSIIEIIFFFNPSIWWISSQVRLEREHCCDDFSVSITRDKMLLVNALAQVESFRVNQPLAMAFGKKRMTLLNRVKRILGVNTKENRGVENIVVMTIVSLILGSVIFFKSDEVNGQIQNLKQKIANHRNQTSLKKDEQLSAKSFSAIKKVSKIDTTIKDKSNESFSTDSFSSGVVYNDNTGYKYFNSESRSGAFWINKLGEIYVDRKKYNASPELLSQIKPFLHKLNLLEEEMEVYSKKMDILSKEMKIYGDKMQDKSKPMEVFGRQMEVQGKLLEEQVKLQTKYSLKASLADLDNEKSEKANYEKLEKEHEKKVDEISKEMDRLGKEMENLGKGMEDDGKPMEEIGKKMEIEGKQMEIIGNKMEVVSKEMIKILPDDLKKKIKEIEKGFKE